MTGFPKNLSGKILISLICLLSFAAISPISAQKSAGNSYKLTKFNGVENKRNEIVFVFKNINKLAFYQNPTLLARIKTLEGQKDYANLLPALEEYVGNFGIQNFHKNTSMLWKLGQLYEMLGQADKAKGMYRLVLKHHRESIEMIKKHYDSITINERDSYVPLKYYYELVQYRKAIDTLRPPKSVLLNMGSEVNSKYEDYGPAMHPKDNLLLFTSQRNVNGKSGKKDEDIYFTRNYDGFWDTAEPFKGINTKFNEGSACLSRDGKMIIFSRCMAPGGNGSCDLYVSNLSQDSAWSEPQNLGINVNSRGWESQPSLSHTEDTLFFSSDRLGGFGLTDIYMSIRDRKLNKWGRALNLGPNINTRGSEVSPFFHPSFKVLYFSSTGHLLQFGDFDIYKVYLENGVWQEPISIGPLVNGPNSEYYFSIDGESKNLFYAKTEQHDLKNLDLYSFPLNMEAQPEAVTRLGGSLRDSLTGAPFKGIVSVIDMTKGIEVAPKYLRPDGSFEFDLIDKSKYLLIIQGEDFFRVEKQVTLNGDTAMHIHTPSVNFKKLKFNSLEFEQASSELLPSMYRDLDRLVNYMLDNPTLNLVIAGHTNKEGNPKDNLILSQKRSNSIKEYLVEFGGIEEHRVKAIGYGDTKPLMEEKGEYEKRINRRVEFEFYKNDEEMPEGGE
jgi:outer membrane protein OmpA-like peptidoglycan-associated protein/tetratricopeptide (TPR) repeat protein